MDTSKLCMYCMEDNGGNDICPHCGKDANAPLITNHLKPGTLLGGRFIVGRAVGQDSSGVVYMVYDQIKGNKQRIREYLPRGIATRAEDGLTLRPMPGMAEQFTEGLHEMEERAESADDPSKAMAHFEENDTLYIVLRKKKAVTPIPVKSKPEYEDDLDEDEAVERESEEEDTSYDEEDEEDEDYDDEDDSPSFTDKLVRLFKKNMVAVLVGFFVLLLLGASIAILVSRNSSDRRDVADSNKTNSPLSNWSAPTDTPIPTAGATDEVGSITPPDLNWQNQAGGNDLNNFGDPTNTPIPDDYEPGWLTQASTEPQVTPTPVPTPTQAPVVTDTPVPAPTNTPEPSQIENPLTAKNIDNDSDERVINQLQQRLVDLGWLDIERTTGNYGKQTRAAVKAFQQYIHDNLDRDMDVDGYAGQQTIAWLNRTDAPHNPDATGAPQPTDKPDDTPQAEPTDAPSQSEPTNSPDATQQPQSSDAPADGGITVDVIDKYSKEDVIKQLQQRLMDLGWLDIDQPTGTYGNQTKDAVKAFQQYIHDNLDRDMDVDGYTGKQTITWLNRNDAPRKSDSTTTEKPVNTVRPTETAAAPDATQTPEPTNTPEPGAPSAEVISQVQSRLIALGWLDASQNTGAYDNATRLALADYQRYLNQINPNTVLPEDGYPDEETLRWLNWDSAPQKPDVMPNPTDVPAATETPQPSSAPFEVNETSPQEDILWLQNRLIELMWLAEGNATGTYDEATYTAVTNVQSYLNRRYALTLTADGRCDNITMSYLSSEYNAPVNPDPSTAVTAPNSGGPQTL